MIEYVFRLGSAVTAGALTFSGQRYSPSASPSISSQVRRGTNISLALSEEMLYLYLCDPDTRDIKPGKSFLNLYLDKVAVHYTYATMALLWFMGAGTEIVAILTRIHMASPTMAEKSSKIDLIVAKIKHKKVLVLLASRSAKYDLGSGRG